MGCPLQVEVHGGMTLVYACRGPPDRSEQGYLAVWLRVGRGFPEGGFFCLTVLRRPEPALFCVTERLCVTPLGGPRCSAGDRFVGACPHAPAAGCRSEEHTSE